MCPDSLVDRLRKAGDPLSAEAADRIEALQRRQDEIDAWYARGDEIHELASTWSAWFCLGAW